MAKSNFTGSHYILILTLIIMNLSCSNNFSSENLVVELNENWELCQADSSVYFPAKVPGCVHTALIDANQIEDPFYRLNEHDLQWIDKKDWIYKTEFNLSQSVLNMDHIILDFKGLDTYADIFLNDTLLLRTDNMFREWEVNCKGLLVKGKNELKILFHSPIKIGLKKSRALPYEIPISGNDLAEIGQVEENTRVSVFTRKAPYHFGWDWGPRFVTSGIWKPVYLKGWNSVRIQDLRIVQEKLNEKEALLSALVKLDGDEESSGKIILKVNGTEVESEVFEQKHAGEFTKEIKFKISNPELWWPNGLGEQVLYNIEVEVFQEDILMQKSAERIGLRSIEVLREADEHGSSFMFVVNGRPVFMKGANYIPQDSFLDRVSPERYEHVIQSAVDANMNMLRIWGGGIYEKDIFYDLCDEKGILVWQDFMFACSMYPGDEAFLDNVRQEAIDNVRRLRNHPCIAIWCGNNENLSAWKGWGWKNNVIQEQGEDVAKIIEKAYDDLFHKLLPEVIEQEDPDRFFWSSSPQSSIGELENLKHGDHHYWGVWWAKDPFSSFKENTGRFMSEYGFQSFPEMKSIEKYALPEDYDIYSEVMKSHQRSSIGNETIELYMKRDYNDPKDFESFIYVGQVLQAEGIKRAIELHRVQMPYCMGSLYWQIDDCWPVASWSGMDYYGKWKALHYAVKEAFKNVIIIPEVIGGLTKISVVSDLGESMSGVLGLKLRGIDGEVLWVDSTNVEVEANKSTLAYSFKHGMIDLDLSSAVLELALFDGEVIIDEALWYYESPKNMKLSEVKIETDIVESEGKYTLTLSSNVLAKNIFLDTKNGEGKFSDNYFDMLPGRNYEIEFIGEELEKYEFVIRSLYDSYN